MEHTLERAPLQFPIGTIINGPEQLVCWEFTRSPHLLIAAGKTFGARQARYFAGRGRHCRDQSVRRDSVCCALA